MDKRWKKDHQFSKDLNRCSHRGREIESARNEWKTVEHTFVWPQQNWRRLMESQERFDFWEVEFSFSTHSKEQKARREREMNHSSNGFWNLPVSLKKPHLKTIKRYDLKWCGLWVILDEENSVYRGAICFSPTPFYAVHIVMGIHSYYAFCNIFNDFIDQMIW